MAYPINLVHSYTNPLTLCHSGIATSTGWGSLYYTIELGVVVGMTTEAQVGVGISTEAQVGVGIATKAWVGVSIATDA